MLRTMLFTYENILNSSIFETQLYSKTYDSKKKKNVSEPSINDKHKARMRFKFLNLNFLKSNSKSCLTNHGHFKE